MSTEICKKTPIGDIRDVVPDTDSCPRSSEFSEPESTYSNTENQKSEKQKLVVTYEDKILQKMKNLAAKNNTIRKLNHARYFSIKKIPGPANVCSKKERRSHSRTQNTEAKNSTFNSSNKKMLIDPFNSNLPHPENVHITTRRAISSNMGKIFDPIGLLTPVTL